MSLACTRTTLPSLTLCGALLACAVLSTVTSGAGEVDGLLGSDVVKRRATVLGNVARDEDGFGRTRFFPDMRFTCNGTISSLTVITGFNPSGDRNPIFRLMREVNGGTCFETLAGEFEVVRPQNEYFIYNFPLSPPVAFQEDDTFALTQQLLNGATRRLVRFYDGQRPGRQSVALDIDTEDSGGQECLTSDSRSNYQAALADMLSPEWSLPLITVTETDAPGCIEGFLSQETLDNFIFSDNGQTRTHEGEQLLYAGDISTIVRRSNNREFPIDSIQFDCTGELRRWTVGAERRAGGSTDLRTQFQIWRRTGNTGSFEYQYERLPQFSDISSADLLPTESLNVYEIAVDPPLQFQQGDVLGVFQPRDAQVVLYYTPLSYPSGTQNYFLVDNVPSTTFEVSFEVYRSDDIPFMRPQVFSPAQTSDVDSNCVSDFYSRGELISLAEFISDPLVSAKQHIIPEIVFRSGGTVTNITFGARYNSEGMSNMELQVWRPSSDDGTRVMLVASTAIDQPTPTADLNMYEFSVALRVSAGDVLGIYTPDDSQFSVLFVENSGPLNYIFESRQQGAVSLEGVDKAYMAPLFTLNLEPDAQTTSPPNGTISATDSVIVPTILQPTPAEPQGGAAGSTVAGVVVALLLLLLVVVAIAITVGVVVWRRHHRKSEGAAAIDHHVGTALDNPVYGGNGTATAKASSNGPQELPVYHTVGVATIEYPPRRNGGTATASDPVYTMLDQTSSLYEIPERYSALCQWGMYVPTQEQREGTSAEHIYASLAESHYAIPGPNPSFFEEADTYWPPASDYTTLYEQLAVRKYREILRPQIRVTSHLGSGQFGTVNKGEWQSPKGGVAVAIKTLQAGSKQEDAVKFLQEAAISGQFRHPNVVKLIGVVTVGEPVMIVLELLANGDLRNYLLKMIQSNSPEPLDASTLLGFSKDVAKGMEYLARKKFVHRDLAARNILVAADKTCKISDFGMSRDLEDHSYYVSHGGQIPVKWTAPEALHFKKYSTASDVWSFGAVMYEIWSLGHKPFEGYTNAQALRSVDKGFRLPPPPGCPKAVYAVMIQCWHGDKVARPSFPTLVRTLSQPPALLLYRSEEEQQSSVLGGAHESSQGLHSELQNTYTGRDYD